MAMGVSNGVAISEALSRLERLDAKIKTAPGQMGLDLTGGSSGGGEKCGAGWIDPRKTCRKEGGGQQAPSGAGGQSQQKPVDDRPIGQRKGTPARAGSESEQQPGADSGTSLAARSNDARRRLVSTIAEVGGLDEKSAELVAGYFLASPKEGGAGVASLDPHIGQFTVKHGGFMDRGVINNAVGAAMQWDAGRLRAKRRESYLAGLSPMARGKAQKALEVMVRNSLSGYVTRQELVEERVAEGFAPITTEKGERRLANRDRVFLTVRDVSAAGMDYAAHLIASQQAQPVLTNPDRYRPGLAAKAKPEGINAQDVTTTAQQAAFARQQQQAAAAAGDRRGAQAWKQEGRKVEQQRLQGAISRTQQSQSSLFGVTEYDESMPLFSRRDSVDPVAQLLGQLLAEQLPGPQVLDWGRHPRGVTAGRVASEGLVYRFRCDSDSIGYRPAWDGIDERQWELRSDGFMQARDPSMRMDFRAGRGGLKFQQQKSKRKCSKGYGCGSACISLNKECRVNPKSAISKARLRQLQTLAQEGDPTAAARSQELQMQRDAKAKGLQQGRQTDRLKKMLEDPRVAEMVRTGRVPTAEGGGAAGAPKPGEVRNVKPDEVEVDAERFQYKMAASKTGEVGSLSGVQVWDPNLAGVVSVWQDPADGKTYVVNGHNRLALAKRLGAEEVTVRYLKAGSAKEARAIGAMQNIAEGAGTEVDAGKFFRDTGLKTLDQVKAKGLPLKSGKTEKGLALAQLPDEIFKDVVQGNVRVRRAAVIGASGLDQDKQREVYKVLKARSSMTDETLQEYVEHLAVSSRQTQTEIDLFGSSKKTVDTGLARAELSNGLKKALGREARLLGAVSKNSQAVELLERRGGNVINVEQSQAQAQEASSVLRVFNQLKSSGSVGSALDQAAARMTAGENKAKVQRELREAVIQAMEEELRQLGLRKDPPKNEAPTMSMFDSSNPVARLLERRPARLDALIARLDAITERLQGAAA